MKLSTHPLPMPPNSPYEPRCNPRLAVAQEPRYMRRMTNDWHTRRDQFLAGLQDRPQVMGILNVTPDSFSDGGQFNTVETAVAQARAMLVDGCDILDIGGESTRPGATPVDEADEILRVLPVLERLAGETEVPLSIDTYKASVARAAIGAGAVIVNDVLGLQKDPEMAETVAETGAAVVIMHNRETADPERNVMADMRAFLDLSMQLARDAGIAEERILVDPGIGFGKTPEQSLTCIQRLDELVAWYNRPVLLGLSRKRFIGHVLENDVEDRLVGTLASNMIGLARGARVLRVHDVRPHVEAVRLSEAILGAA